MGRGGTVKSSVVICCRVVGFVERVVVMMGSTGTEISSVGMVVS